ncbi:MAG: hypothetical protein WB462_11810 [Solirubrobacterales bacterium]
MSVVRSDPLVWGGEVVPAQGEMRGYEREQGGPVDFGYELPVEGAGEEVAVYLGELRQATEEPARPTGTMGGRVWGAVSVWLGGDDAA